jgi:Uma2 family endonuclease
MLEQMSLHEPVQLHDDEKPIVLEDVSWEFYEAVLREFDERPSRISYDDGLLEIQTTLSIEHEGYKDFLAAVVGELAIGFGTPIARRGSATLKLKPKKKGLEADQCFWIANASAIRGQKRLNLSMHPPPDLVIEVDVTHAVVDRESIYASLGVPEMWHYNAKTRLTGWSLNVGKWHPIETSKSFPQITFLELNGVVDRFTKGEDETAILLEFRRRVAELAGQSR